MTKKKVEVTIKKKPDNSPVEMKIVEQESERVMRWKRLLYSAPNNIARNHIKEYIKKIKEEEEDDAKKKKRRRKKTN